MAAAGTPSALQYAFLVPAALTIVGWFVVAKQADRREFRKEVREQLKELRASIDEVRARTTSYWLESDAERAPAAAIALKAELKRLSRLAQTMIAAGLRFDHARLVADVRLLATGGNFEKKGRRRGAADGERVDDVVGALEDLLTAVDAAFYTEFSSARTSRLWLWLPIIGFFMLARDLRT